MKKIGAAFGKAVGAVFFLMMAEIGLAFATGWVSMLGWRGSGALRPLAQILLYPAALSILWSQSRSAWLGEEARSPSMPPPPPSSGADRQG